MSIRVMWTLYNNYAVPIPSDMDYAIIIWTVHGKTKFLFCYNYKKHGKHGNLMATIKRSYDQSTLHLALLCLHCVSSTTVNSLAQ